MVKKRLKKVFPVVAILVFGDYFSKLFVKTHFFPFTKITIIRNFLNLVYVRNKGIAFGLLGSLPDTLRKIFLLWLPFLTCIILLAMILFSKNISKLNFIGFTLIVSGAIGNLIDRFFYGYVVDFIDFYYKLYHWPAFNFADSYISIGISLVIIDMFLQKK